MRMVCTGGAGFLGQHVVALLRERGHEVCVPRQSVYDLRSQIATQRLLAAYRPQVVIHLAAACGGIGINRQRPGDFFRDNLLMGLPEEQIDLSAAVYAAVMERDIEELEQGMETLIGPRGVKLSGGQQQRAAAARMFVRDPELLVFDDLSSALDVETEQLLWQRLFARRRATCLVVSHRRPALRRADRIILLREGRVEAEGTLEELLQSCAEMQRLWQETVT